MIHDAPTLSGGRRPQSAFFCWTGIRRVPRGWRRSLARWWWRLEKVDISDGRRAQLEPFRHQVDVAAVVIFITVLVAEAPAVAGVTAVVVT